MSRHWFLLASLATTALACAGTTTDESNDEAAGELRTGTITKIVVGSTRASNASVVDCYVNGQWTVDFAAKHLVGNACLHDKTVTVDRDLTTADVNDLRARVARIRTTKRPTKCQLSAASNSLTVERGANTAHYVDAHASCIGGVTPVVEAGLGDVVEALLAMSTPSDPCASAHCSANDVCVVADAGARCVPWMPTPP